MNIVEIVRKIIFSGVLVNINLLYGNFVLNPMSLPVNSNLAIVETSAGIVQTDGESGFVLDSYHEYYNYRSYLDINCEPGDIIVSYFVYENEEDYYMENFKRYDYVIENVVNAQFVENIYTFFPDAQVSLEYSYMVSDNTARVVSEPDRDKEPEYRCYETVSPESGDIVVSYTVELNGETFTFDTIA